MNINYPDYYDHLQNLAKNLADALPGPMSGLRQLHKEALTDGVLNAKVKELIALSIAISVKCEGCLTYHLHDALRAGATREEIVETIGVAILMGGGPSMVYGAQALEALEQFQSSKNG